MYFLSSWQEASIQPPVTSTVAQFSPRPPFGSFPSSILNENESKEYNLPRSVDRCQVKCIEKVSFISSLFSSSEIHVNKIYVSLSVLFAIKVQKCIVSRLRYAGFSLHEVKEWCPQTTDLSGHIVNLQYTQRTFGLSRTVPRWPITCNFADSYMHWVYAWFYQ